jgi:hypothetical protein
MNTGVAFSALHARFVSGLLVTVPPKKAGRIKGPVTFVTVQSFTLLRHFSHSLAEVGCVSGRGPPQWCGTYTAASGAQQSLADISATFPTEAPGKRIL